jgi:hypothetical protein
MDLSGVQSFNQEQAGSAVSPFLDIHCGLHAIPGSCQ